MIEDQRYELFDEIAESRSFLRYDVKKFCLERFLDGCAITHI